MSSKGLDIGTNMLVAGMMDEEGNPIFKMQRDAFYKIVPKSEVNRNSIRLSLEKRGSNFVIDEAGSFIVVGEDALEIAIERNDSVKRPLQRGVISPREKDSLPMLKLIIEKLIDRGEPGDKLVYSVPAKPVDSVFDIVYHTEMMGMYIREMGYEPFPLNEAFAIALSELLDDGLTGICVSYGAGMTNIAVVHEGDPLVEFSITRAGDFIDISVGNALDISPSLVQMEKESGIDLYAPAGDNKIKEAVSVYYSSVISYTWRNIAYELERRKKELPMFRSPVPIVVSGGLTLAEGFTRKIEEILPIMGLPMQISEVKRAAMPMQAVAAGALLASQI
jgi:hypothetical protein